MTLNVWLAFVVLETVLCFTPGPAVLFVVSTSLARGARAGLGGAWGIVACNTFYFLLSALGVAAVILASNRLFTALKWLGAAYLVWIGVRMIIVRAAPAQAVEEPKEGAGVAAFVRGFAVQAANPKALAFFVALLPQFIDVRASVPEQVAILALTSVAIEICVLALYVRVATRAGAYAGQRWAVWLNRVAGGLLVAAGARLAIVRAA
ncbi:MAG TPA: LysE family translocator [Gammaproteobacteria bacterium]|nr:LysE family translocator [Gammaproteobacteria bacterium]